MERDVYLREGSRERGREMVVERGIKGEREGDGERTNL